MKVLFDHPWPFCLTHGGFQTQIEQTRRGLEACGVEVEWLRWWDDRQGGDIIHYFGRPPGGYIHFAQARGIRVLCAELLTGVGSRSGLGRWAQALIVRVGPRLLPSIVTGRMGWEAYRMADGLVALTGWEAQLMQEVFGAAPDRVHVVPNGVEEVFFGSDRPTRGPWLVCAATITGRKRVLELAEAALLAGTPLRVLGKPYGDDDPYARRFVQLAREHSSVLRYEGSAANRGELARAYREARGFVLLSAMESHSLAAAEAAACECPLLLSDLPWARSVFGEGASYCPINRSARATASRLREFYERAPALPPAPRPLSWVEVGARMKGVYEGVLGRGRPARLT
jgi:glycosyltransferase involved in cell wall biosynthesis